MVVTMTACRLGRAVDIAHVGSTGDGVVAVVPVERFFRVRTASEALP
jgi:nitrogen regulatory protein P-II 1